MSIENPPTHAHTRTHASYRQRELQRGHAIDKVKGHVGQLEQLHHFVGGARQKELEAQNLAVDTGRRRKPRSNDQMMKEKTGERRRAFIDSSSRTKRRKRRMKKRDRRRGEPVFGAVLVGEMHRAKHVTVFRQR